MSTPPPRQPEEAIGPSSRHELRRRLQEFETLLELLPVGVFIAQDRDCRHISTMNPAGATMLGLAPDANASKTGPDSERLPFRVLQRGVEVSGDDLPMQRAARTGAPVFGEECEVVHHDGSSCYLYEYATPLFDSDGAVRGSVGVFVDITARKTAEERLRRQYEQLKVLSEAAGYLLQADDADAMVRGLFERIKDQLGIDAYFYFVVDASGAALSLTSYAGIPAESARGIERMAFGQSVCGHVAVHRRPVVASHIQDSTDRKLWRLRSFGIRAYACNPLIAGNRLIGTLSFGSRTKNFFNEDELEFMCTLCHYVAAAFERVTLISSLREADRRKDEFLAMLAHELRNPLAPIAHGLNIIQMMCAERPTTRLAHQMMERQVSHLVCLVNDLLEISRITRGAIELRRERIEIGAVVDGAVETSRPFIEAAGHRLHIDMPSEPIWLDADPIRLSQVIANLLNNAAKYTRPGGDIRLSARREGDEAAISVSDTGIGIPPDMLGRIFEMFEQVDRTRRSSQDGLGIGLTLARTLVRMHGGRIEARSEGVDRGSEFTLRLPVSTAETTAAPVTGSAERRLRATHRRILVVDDNVDAAESLGMLLDLLGHQVQVVTSGPLVQQAARDYQPDVILLDIGLPDMDGCEVARRLRADPAFAEVLLVAMTGYGREDDRRRSHEAGFDRHLVKPVSLDALDALLALSGDGALGTSADNQARAAAEVAPT